jgi:uncharacterized protein YwgA
MKQEIGLKPYSYLEETNLDKNEMTANIDKIVESLNKLNTTIDKKL